MSAFDKFLQFCFAFVLMLLAACGGQYVDQCDKTLGITAGCEDTAATEDTQPDADTDTDADSDTDSDTDTDTDSDSDTDTDTDTDTGPELTPEQECWGDIPFAIQFRHIDHSKAETVDADWTSLTVVDTDQIQILDASTDSTLTAFWDPRYACGSAPEGQSAFMPDSYVDPMLGDEAHNRVAAVLQPDGTVFEMSYLAACGGGEYMGWVLPDPDYAPLNACDGEIPDYWFGGQGGSHFTATQALRPGELTGSSPIGRPLPIEVDKTHLYYSPEESDGEYGYRWPATSADGYYTSYSGTIPDLQMGSILVLTEDFDCTSMLSTPGERYCEVARDFGLIIVDDTYVPAGRVSIPMTVEADVEFETSEGYSPGDALSTSSGYDTDFGQDVQTILTNAKVLTNPEEAWIE